MKINTSYELRGERQHTYISIPKPSLEDLTEVHKHIAWVAGREAPRVSISES